MGPNWFGAFLGLVPKVYLHSGSLGVQNPEALNGGPGGGSAAGYGSYAVHHHFISGVTDGQPVLRTSLDALPLGHLHLGIQRPAAVLVIGPDIPVGAGGLGHHGVSVHEGEGQALQLLLPLKSIDRQGQIQRPDAAVEVADDGTGNQQRPVAHDLHGAGAGIGHISSHQLEGVASRRQLRSVIKPRPGNVITIRFIIIIGVIAVNSIAGGPDIAFLIQQLKNAVGCRSLRHIGFAVRGFDESFSVEGKRRTARIGIRGAFLVFHQPKVGGPGDTLGGRGFLPLLNDGQKHRLPVFRQLCRPCRGRQQAQQQAHTEQHDPQPRSHSSHNISPLFRHTADGIFPFSIK